MIVTFCGHRDFVETAEAENQLTMFLEKYARENVRLVCYNGGYGNFDYFAAKCVQRMQEQYSNIRNCLVLPYIDQPFLERIEIFKNHFDETIYPLLESVPRKYAIIRRNEWMVDSADIVIAYVTYSWGGAARTLEYARRKKKILLRYKKAVGLCPTASSI